ncbi:transglutaminase domain-containing protein [Candidatus Collierbacteria bacterium]|nr:transglutaminase domain-containing protein [Candidatus Collierbacteria bacterium]
MQKSISKFFFVLSFTFLYLFVPSAVFASSDFSTSFNSTYEIRENISAHAAHQVSLTNLKENTYASEFSLIIGSTNIDSITARDHYGLLPVAVNSRDNGVAVTVNLKSRPALGVNQTKEFVIRYESRDTVQKVGRIIEINIPKLTGSREFNSFSTNLLVPVSFDEPSIMVPEPTNKTSTSKFSNYVFDRNDETGISAVFGQSQTFAVKLQYFLENPEDGQEMNQIALPPDTAYQKINIQKINPKPKSIEADADGNWLAWYKLAPKQKVTVEVDLSIELTMTPFSFGYAVPLPDHLKSTRYWQADDPEIAALAGKLKTPRQIYDYVVSNLTYDYERAGKSGERKGAKFALSNPNSAICTEFTDLFVALARAAGIPARELEGFAWTENPKLRPLSLSSDILHAWPEYWDKDKNVWVQIDPTWGNTSGNIDYFSKLDFNHIVFAIHGRSDVSPLSAGFYKTNDDQKKTVRVEPRNVRLSFDQGPEVKIIVPNIMPTYKFNPISVKFSNSPSYGVYGIPVSVESPESKISSAGIVSVNLLPFENKEVEIKIKPKNFWRSGPIPVTVKIGSKIYEYRPKGVSPLKPIIGILIGTAAISGVLFAAVRSGNLRLPGFIGNSDLYRKIKKS